MARGPGPVEAALKRDLRALISGHPFGDALEAMSLTLARTLDAGTDQAAQVNRQLRENLAELARLAGGGADELDAELSAPSRDAEDPGPG